MLVRSCEAFVESTSEFFVHLDYKHGLSLTTMI